MAPEWSNEVPIATLINSANAKVNATTASVQAAIQNMTGLSNLVVSLIDSLDASAYPICGLTYIAIYNQTYKDCFRQLSLRMKISILILS